MAQPSRSFACLIKKPVVNFIQRPLPANSSTGALMAGADFNNDVPGALGMGQRASTGLTLCE
jgi:POT family proton-dependent oligopeptide transporter